MSTFDPLGPMRAGTDGEMLLPHSCCRYPKFVALTDDENILLRIIRYTGMTQGEVIRALATAQGGLDGKGNPR